jgi:hypothetical protein
VFPEFQGRTLSRESNTDMSRRLPLITVVIALAAAAGCRREPSAAAGLAKLEQAFPDRTAAPVVQVAIAAARTNELGQGVIALQGAKRMPGLTAEQLQAVEQASLALTRELLRRAEAGDARARAELDLIERTHSQ